MTMITVAQYVATRLKQLGVEHLFGIPGNYSAEFLLAAEQAGIRLIGTANELEAGYAADAYARYRGIGACSVTYGVGSQSLYNAIAGAYVEFCPVVLVSGSPPLEKVANLKNRNILFAHAIDPLRTDMRIFEPVTVAATEIVSADDAPAEIDRVLQACITNLRPVYLEVHQGVWREPCDPPQGRLKSIPPTEQQRADQETATDVAVELVRDRIKKAAHPVLWGGELIQRLGIVDEFRELVAVSGIPYTTTLMGKGLIAETEFPQQFIGVYDSKFVSQTIKTAVETSDCLLALGTILSDFYAEVAISSAEQMILATRDSVTIHQEIFNHVPLDRFLRKLAARWPKTRASAKSLAGLGALVESRGTNARSASAASQDIAPGVKIEPSHQATSTKLTWDNFFAWLGTKLTDKSIVLTDTGLALFPSAELPIQRVGGFLAQTAWLSIGYTGGATLGVALAVPDAKVLAIVGDGGFQMVPQSLSTLVRQQRAAITFVMDNGLYGIEQFLIDEQILAPGTKFYRDGVAQPSSFDILPAWDYAQLSVAFGGRGRAVTTLAELEDAYRAAAAPPSLPMLIAVKLDPHDLPSEIAAAIQPPSSAPKVDGGDGNFDSEEMTIALASFN